MIQRIQTVYLFLSALFTALLLFLPLAVGVTVSGGPVRGYALGLDRPCLGRLAELRGRPLDRGGLVGARARARSGHDLWVSEPSVAKKTVHRAGRSVACRLRTAGLVPGQLCRSAFRMEPFRRLGLSRRIADPDTAGYARDFQGRAVGPFARPDSVISKRAPDRFFRPGCACRRSSCVPRAGTVRVCVRCLGTGAAMRLRLS